MTSFQVPLVLITMITAAELCAGSMCYRLPEFQGHSGDSLKGMRAAKRRAIPYAFLREGDVVWQKRSWREIDLRSQQNQEAPYHISDSCFHQALSDVLIKGILSNELIAFKDQQFRIPYAMTEIRHRLMKAAPMNKGMEAVDTPAIDISSIYAHLSKYIIKEDWFFDRQRSVTDVRIVGIALLACNERQEEYELFWVYFPACRPYFAAFDVHCGCKGDEVLSLDDVFWKRQFTSHPVCSQSPEDSCSYDTRP